MIELKSMAVAMPEVVGHPNRVAFSGVLTMVDVPSQRAPSGAKGHLRCAYEAGGRGRFAFTSGNGIGLLSCLDRHDVRRKVGVITRAEIVGRNVELGGHLFARDFPEIVEEIGKSRPGGDHRPIDSLRARLVNAGVIHAAVDPYGCPTSWAEGSRLRASLRTAVGRIRSLTARARSTSETRLERDENFIRRYALRLAWRQGRLALGCRTK